MGTFWLISCSGFLSRTIMQSFVTLNCLLSTFRTANMLSLSGVFTPTAGLWTIIFSSSGWGSWVRTKLLEDWLWFLWFWLAWASSSREASSTNRWEPCTFCWGLSCRCSPTSPVGPFPWNTGWSRLRERRGTVERHSGSERGAWSQHPQGQHDINIIAVPSHSLY